MTDDKLFAPEFVYEICVGLAIHDFLTKDLPLQIVSDRYSKGLTEHYRQVSEVEISHPAEEILRFLSEQKKPQYEAHEKANTIVKLAEEESRKLRDNSLQETQAKCKQMLEEAEREIKRNQEKVLQEVRGHIAQLTIASTEKILKKTISQDDKNRLAEESIEEVLAEMKGKSTV